MIDYNGLNERVKESGMTKAFIAKKLGITRANLYDKLRGKRMFDSIEISILKDILHLDDATFLKIFFISNVDNLSTKVVVNG